MQTVEKTDKAPVEKPKRKERPPVIPAPREGISGRKPLELVFHVGADFISHNSIPSSDNRRKGTSIWHLYPQLSQWIGRKAPDDVNPRSHDPECLKSPVARQIEQTILERPDDFPFANRGITVLADEVKIDKKTGTVTLIINNPENQGLADGATTDAVLAKVQTALARQYLEKSDATFADLNKEQMPEILKQGRIHIEVIEGLADKGRIEQLVHGRNTSRQVRGWSMADFRGEFQFLKDILEDEKSPFKGKIGYEENSAQDINILDVLSILTLFHPEFEEKEEGTGTLKAPVVAYANKGRMDTRLQDEKLLAGYKSLLPIAMDVLILHDYIFSNFEKAYDANFGPKARLGRREGVKSMLLEKPYELPLTGMKSNYIIPAGFIFPLLAGFRALVSWRGGDAHWKTGVDAFKFFDNHGKDLIAELMEKIDDVGGNPNVAGKRKQVYTALYAAVKISYSEDRGA